MNRVRATIEVKVQKDFKPCEHRIQQHEKGECPFTYWDTENSQIDCCFVYEDCPMKNMKLVE